MDRNVLKENRLHGDAMLPLSVYHNDIKSGENILDCHWHNELEFLLVTEGKVLMQIETNYYEVSAGQAIFLNSGEIHAGFSSDNSSCSFSAIVFDPILLSSRTYDALQIKYIDPIVKNCLSLPKHIKGTEPYEKEILEYLKEIIEIFDSKVETHELLIKANLYLVFSRLISNCSQTVLRQGSSADLYKTDRLKSVLNYIHTNYSQRMNIKELAVLINMSEGHFCRFFKQMTRRTPVDYINYYRISQAAKLLEGSDKKVFDIAMDVGFYNFSYFINIFNHYMKCTPSQYRRNDVG